MTAYSLTPMSTDLHELLRSRLAAIADEEEQLRRVVEILGSESRALSPSRGSGGRRRNSKGKRAARGERRSQLLAAIKESPGSSPKDLAELTGMGPTQIYGLARKLQDDGEIKKSGKGFELAD